MALAVAAVVAACSSSNSNNGGGTINNPYPNCAAAGGGSGEANANTTCGQCMQSNCASQVNATFTGCKDYFDCACASGANPLNCLSKLEEQSCTNASSSVSSCEQQFCKTQCNAGDGGTGVNPQDSGTIGVGGGDGGALSAACQQYVTCCVASAGDAGSAITASCQSSASFMTDAECSQQVATYQDAGVVCQ
jgi:hypothetical protein